MPYVKHPPKEPPPIHLTQTAHQVQHEPTSQQDQQALASSHYDPPCHQYQEDHASQQYQLDPSSHQYQQDLASQQYALDPAADQYQHDILSQLHPGDIMAHYYQQQHLAAQQFQQDLDLSTEEHPTVIAAASCPYAPTRGKKISARSSPFSAESRDNSQPCSASTEGNASADDATSERLEPVGEDVCYSCSGSSGYTEELWMLDLNGDQYWFCEGCLPFFQVLNGIQLGEIVGTDIIRLQGMMQRFLKTKGIPTTDELRGSEPDDM